MDYAALRKSMVETQLIPRGIENKRVLDAFYAVQRHKFIPDKLLGRAYDDCPLPIGEGQTISQPYIVALMTELLDLSGEEKVLEIGTGSGYQTAILAKLAKAVYTIERKEELAKGAETILSDLGYKNIIFKVGDGTLGFPEETPFDRIIITAAASFLPEPLSEQLREGGKIVAPIGGSFGQVLTLFTKKSGKLQESPICGCAFVPLVGKYSERQIDA